MSTEMRPAVRTLVNVLAFRATFGRPCYVKVANNDAALIVPHLTDGPSGPYAYLRTFSRTTVFDAVEAGLVVLGDTPVTVPSIDGQHWSAQDELQGRTIALASQRVMTEGDRSDR